MHNSTDYVERLHLYFVRHGMTFFNTMERTQGFCDSLLTDKGVQQAVQTGKALENISFFAAYCGDLGRHRKTAQHILDQNLHTKPTLTEFTRLREQCFGAYEGLPDDEMWSPVFEKYGLKYDPQFSQYENLVETLGFRGICEEIACNDPLNTAEHYEEVLSRVESVLGRIIKDAAGTEGQNVLVVTSAHLLSFILTLTVPDSYQNEHAGNCSITSLMYDKGSYSLFKLADESHLQIKGKTERLTIKCQGKKTKKPNNG